MEYEISNPGPIDAHNPISGKTPNPPCKCWNCKKSDKVIFRDLSQNTRIIAYCGRCDTQFNVKRLIIKETN